MAQYASLIGRRPETVQAQTINPTSINARMDYRPMDSDYMLNQMQQQAATSNRMLQNNAGGNAALANQMLMAQNIGNQSAQAQALMQVGDINQQRRNQALQFNTGIQAQNAANDMGAQQFNAQARMQANEANAMNRAALENTRSALMSSIGTQLGNIGTENR